MDEIDALKAENAAQQAEIESLKSGNASAQEALEALTAENAAHQAEIDALKEENAAQQAKIEALEADNAAAQEEIDALKAANQALQEKIEALEAQIRELESNVTPSEPKIRIYIDQGHNPTSYHNAGASGNGLYEQDVTYTVGILLAALLEADGRFEICLSRPTEDTVLGTDNDSSLDARVAGAIAFEADYFISLHTNFFETDTANGIEVYVAEAGSTSYDFGASLLQGLLGATGLYNRGMKLNPELRVLKNTTMPAALLELGFISNPTDAALMAQSPALFAQGIYDGILSYFELSPNDAAN
ncbi:MAG: N-acetylmuramoyl-L-alanine amidase [Clostridia bacterium]|nr:N-acetylmuramoyl-L-alanine amidase [Clostridia bacterium]